jgi:hypothetical protein
MNDLSGTPSTTPTRFTAERPICVAVMAMGGQGGGVLADWIVELAEAQGWHAQSTSVPGVTKPRRMERPASASSAAMTMSTSPGAGISDRIGARPAFGGNIST